ncbi:MAG: formate--tetrahydrofolate ligase [Oscillospiraceae bacterium]|nr:formate--tetrahydrofolate ligase [Oscillospiraceae bacterium]
MKRDIEIAQETVLEPITQIAAKLGLAEDRLEPYGRTKAKILPAARPNQALPAPGHLILVTAINPTAAGEGKTTVNIGLSMALNRLGYKAVSALREPSLGPCFGIKGGAAGGGLAQVLPMEDINLHFTGDFHAITSAHNLLAAVLDNSLQQGNPLDIDPRRVTWKRVLDMNDRTLRHIVIGLGGPADGIPRESGFDITVTSEIMAILCLARDLADLKARLGRIVVAYTRQKTAVTANDLGVTGALTLLLKDAVKPNLVQTVEHTPAIIHGGPFANIAHGCNSLIATQTALNLADYVVTEAGFGADLGAEKFFDIKCRTGQLKPEAVVLVATIRALKLNGGQDKKALGEENLETLTRGSVNLRQHAENLRKFGVPVVIAINHFPSDTEAEIKLLEQLTAAWGFDCVQTDVFSQGSAGGVDLARAVLKLCQGRQADFTPLYALDEPLETKIATIAREIYRADGVEYSQKARRQLNELQDQGYGDLPVCMAKTQYSFSDDPRLLGAPRGFQIHVRELNLNAGAGFVVALTGDIMTMPGLPKVPAACGMDIAPDGRISGLS